MICIFCFTVRDLLDVVQKGGNMTLSEKKTLDRNLELLKSVKMLENGTQLDEDQRTFLKNLPELIKADLPRLERVMQVYGLSLDTFFKYESDAYGLNL